MKAIIGFDPGVTCGLAIIGLDGRRIHLGSYRDTSLSDIVALIMKHAEPVIVGTDVSPTPSSVVKLSRLVGAEIFTPELSLTVEEKRYLSKDYNPKDHHQRDSLAAALVAYRVYRPLIEKIRLKSGKRYEEVFEKILSGEASKISEALADEIKKIPKQRPTPTRIKLLSVKRHRDKLLRELDDSKLIISDLKQKLRKTERELEQYENKLYRDNRKDKTVKSLETQVHDSRRKEKAYLERARASEKTLQHIENWLLSRKDRKFICSDLGPGVKIGSTFLVEDPHSTIETIIKQHRKKSMK